MTDSTKTGAPPSFKAQSDLSRVIPAVGASVGIEDIGKAIEFYKKNRGTIDAVIRFFKGLFGGGKKEVPAPVPQPAPQPSEDVDESEPAPTPAPGTGLKVVGLKAKWFFIERKNTPGQQGGGRHILDKSAFDSIVAGSEYARLGDRLHVNITPYDQHGRDFVPGGDENRLLLNNPSGEDDTPNHRIKHEIRGNGELTSEYDDYGCTPVILVPWVGEQIDSDKESSVSYVAKFYGPDGRVIESAELPAIKTRA